MRQALVIEKKIRLLQEQRPDDPELPESETLYDKLTSLWGQAIAATPSFLPKLRRRLVIV